MDNDVVLVFANNFQIRDTSVHTTLTDPMLLPVLFVDGYGTRRTLFIYNLHDQTITLDLYGWAGVSSTFANKLFTVDVPANTRKTITSAEQPSLDAPYVALSIHAKASVLPTSGGLYVRAIVK